MRKCSELIFDKLEQRIKDFKEALEQTRKGSIVVEGDEYEDFYDWINCYALSYTDDPYYRAKRLELSCGGPADYFLFFEDGTIEYRYLDWFDGASVVLDGEDYEVMSEVRDFLEVY